MKVDLTALPALNSDIRGASIELEHYAVSLGQMFYRVNRIDTKDDTFIAFLGVDFIDSLPRMTNVSFDLNSTTPADSGRSSAGGPASIRSTLKGQHVFVINSDEGKFFVRASSIFLSTGEEASEAIEQIHRSLSETLWDDGPRFSDYVQGSQ